MTQFQVFLPPVSLQPLAGSAGFPPVQFRVVAQPSSFSLRSFSQSIERPLLGPALVDLVVERASKRRKANVAEQPVEEGRDIDAEDAGDLSRAWREKGGSPSWITRPDISDTAMQQLGEEHDGQSRVEPDSASVDISRSRLTRTKSYPTPTPNFSGHRRQSQRLNPAGESSSSLSFFFNWQPHRRVLTPAEYTHILPLPLADDTILSLNTTISLSPSQPSQQRAKDPDIYGDTSITNFPRWVVPLSKLISLDILLSHPRTLARPRAESDSGEGKISVIVCVTATSPPVLRRKKEERARGAEGSLWVAKWDIVAPSGLGAAGGTSMSKDRAEGSGEVGCEVVLWDKCARDYGEVVRRGDVVLLEGT